MKNSELEDFFNSEIMERYKSDPLWFRNILAKSNYRSYKGDVSNIAFFDRENIEPAPVVTLLRYLRPISPDYNSPVDDYIPSMSNYFNVHTPVILVPEKDENTGRIVYSEPISGLKVNFYDLYRLNQEDVYNLTIDDGVYVTLDCRDDEVEPYGFVDEDAKKRWQEGVVSHRDELVQYFEEVKKKTENNFGLGFVSSDDIIGSLGQ